MRQHCGENRQGGEKLLANEQELFSGGKMTQRGERGGV